MPVTTRRAARTDQVDDPVAPESVELPLIDLPEWAENTLQVVSFGAFTPRSAERRAVEAAARLRREASADVAVELDYEEYQDGNAAPPSPPQSRKSPRLLSAATVQQAYAKQARAAAARIAAQTLDLESAAAARAAADADSDEVDAIISARAAQLKREKKKDSKTRRAREAREAEAMAAAEAAAADAASRREAESGGDTESDVASDDEEPVVTPTFGKMAKGSLQLALDRSGRPELAAFGETMRRIDVVDLDDFFILSYEQMTKEVKKVNEKFSLMAYSKVRKAVELAILEASAGARGTPSGGATGVVPPVQSTGDDDSSGDDEPAAVAALVAGAGAQKAKKRAVLTGFLPGLKEVRDAKDGVLEPLPAWIASLSHARVLLSRLTNDERRDEKSVASFLLLILKMTGVTALDEAEYELVAEQVDDLLKGLDSGEGPTSPSLPGKRGARDAVRLLVKTRDARTAAAALVEKAAAVEAGKRQAASTSLHQMWTAPEKGEAKNSLVHTRGLERVQAVIDNRASLKCLSELYSSIGNSSGAESFVKDLETAQRTFPELNELLHHKKFPSASSGALAALNLGGGPLGLEGGRGEGGAVPVETVAWCVMAVVDIQSYFFQQGSKKHLKNRVVNAVDVERLLKAAFFGEISTAKSASGVFSLSELTNPSDPSVLVSAKATEAEIRTAVTSISALGVALAAAHPSDPSVHNVIAEVTAACQPETASGPMTGTVVNAALGSFMREYSVMWADFQTNRVACPTAEAAWEEARKDNAVETAHRKEVSLSVVELKANDAKNQKVVRDLGDKNKSIEERLKRLEQSVANRGSGGAAHPAASQPAAAGGAAPGAFKVLKDDVFHAKLRAKDAKAESEAADAASAADAPAKKAAAKDADAKLAKSEAALAKAKETQGK